MSIQPSTSPHAASRSGGQFVGFLLDGQQYLFRIEGIREIVTPGRLTRLPEVPGYILGVSNLRGTIIPVIDLRRLFGLAPQEIDSETRTVVAVVGGRVVGCMVDAVSQVIRLAAEQLAPADETVVPEAARYVAGFARLPDGLAIVLDVGHLLDPDLLEHVHRAGLPRPAAPAPPTGASAS